MQRRQQLSMEGRRRERALRAAQTAAQTTAQTAAQTAAQTTAEAAHVARGEQSPLQLGEKCGGHQLGADREE